MKRRSIVIGIGLVVCAIWLIGMSGAAFAADKYRFKMQHLHSAPEIVKFHQDFAEKVKTNTGGRIVIDVFPSGALVPTAQMAQAVGTGTLDMAFCYGGYHSGALDVANIESGLPMAWGNIDEATRFHQVLDFDTMIREAYAGINVRWMNPVMENPFLLLTKKPVHSLADLKPMKIRATVTIASILKPFGIATVYLPAEEFYTALSTGVIDGVIYGSEASYAGLKLQEVAPYITDMKILNPMSSAIIMNKKTWEGMPADLKGILEETSKAAYGVSYFAYRAKLDAAARKHFKATQFNAEDVAKLTGAAQAVWDTEAKKSPRVAKGVELLRALAKDHGRL